MKIIFENWKWNWKCALTPHDFHFVLKSNERFDYILNALREIPPRETYVIYVRVCVCVFVVHICNASYTKIEFLTRSLDGGRPTQRRQAWNFAYFSHVNDTEVFHPLLTFSWYMHAGEYLDFTASISYRFNQVNIFFPEINVLASESKENVKFEIRNI